MKKQEANQSQFKELIGKKKKNKERTKFLEKMPLHKQLKCPIVSVKCDFRMSHIKRGYNSCSVSRLKLYGCAEVP